MKALWIALILMLGGVAAAAPKPWIGIALAPGTSGVLVKSVIDGTPGQRAGLHTDDEVLSIDGDAVKTPRDLIDRIATKAVGTKVTVEIKRGDKPLKITLELEARPEELALLKKQLLDKPAPPFAFADAIGPSPAALDKLKGHVVLIEFWATWCGFCKTTRPALSGWQAKYKELRVLGISSDELDDIKKLAADEKVGYTLARDPGDRIAGTYLVPALPTFVVIDKAGVVRYVGVGGGDGFDGVQPAIEKLLK